jgi:NADH dehydrogenase FAD-containing subunit
MNESRHRVVIVGCGFGGLFAARALRRADVDVTVIDRNNHHLFQPLLYQMATGILAEGDVAPPIRDILRHQRNVSVLLGEVQSLDLQRRLVTVDTLGQHSDVPYDSLILATGASQSYFGNPEFARHAPGMKTIDDALELRSRIFGAFEMAEREPDAALRKVWLTFVVVGAGPTGVELAGQIAEPHGGRWTTTSATSTRPPRGSCSSTPDPRFFRRFQNRNGSAPRERSRAWVWKYTSARWSRVWISVASTLRRTTRNSSG